MKSLSPIFILVFLLLFSWGKLCAQAPGLYINEVSQGPSGAKEYVELIVVGNPTCFTIPTVDLRGWYIDDNNGFHATGAGTGIAQGCVRFTQDPLWAAVPVGTLIVIHNDADVNAAVPANDLSLSDGNCRLVIPVSNCALLEKHLTLPSVALSPYPATGFAACGNWTNISMANSDDSFQTIDPAGNLFHSVSWGNNTLSTIIYFAGTSAGLVAQMTNAVTNNITTQANWTRVAVAGNESPGAPNNAANQAWICRMNNGCTPVTPMLLSMSSTNASCTCTGSATVTASGGFNGCGGGYTYSWAPSGGTAATATGLCAGTYTVTVADVNGCTATQTVSITAATSFTLTTTQTNVACFGGNTGTANVAVSGGTGPFSYSWLPSGGTSATATGLAAGTYTVNVTDASSCTGTAIVTITQPPVLATTGTQTNVLCNGGLTGSASVVASGGTGPYTYAWAPSGGTGSTGTGLGAGTYTVTVTDANGCTTTRTFTITQPPVLATTGTQTNVLCNGGLTGSASIVASGGTGPYTYAWTPSGGTGSTATGLGAGTYTATITDANGCTTTRTFAITQPNVLASTTSFTQATCAASNGSAAVVVSGGTGPYTYLWSPSGGTGATATALAAGIYTVVYTDANGCTGTATVNVPNANAPVVSIVASDSVNCFGGSDGYAAAASTGGTTPYTYLWSNGDADTLAGNLSSGSYTVTVTDASGCITTATVSIGEPPLLSVATTATDVLCFGGNTGAASASANGGVGPYTWLWSPTGGTNASASGLLAGTYTVTITDANGCSTTTVAAITEQLALAVTTSTSNVLCFGGATGSATSGVTGGVGPYTYSWSPSGGTSPNASGLIAGNYSVTVTDANGCTALAGAAVTEPTSLSATTSFTQATCNTANGSAEVVVTGGSAGYTYLWSPSGGSNALATGLTAGSYSCLVTDANGCTMSLSITVPNANAPTASIGTTSNVTCFGGNDGSATASAIGGVGPYVYLWSNSDPDSLASNLVAGTYTITVTDASGCTSTSTVLITEPTQVNVQASANPTSVCEGFPTTLTATAGGGTPGYTYVWTPGPLIGQTQNITPAATQTYVVTVTDANGCTTSTPIIVTVNPTPVVLLAADDTAGCAPLCVNFSDLSAISTGTITGWSWDFGDNTNSTQQDPNHCYTAPGIYSVVLTVTSATGCTGTLTVGNYINVFATPIAGFTYSPQPVTLLNPNVTFTDASQGATTWLWSFGDVLQSTSTQQNPSFTYDDSECHQVVLTVTNPGGCSDTVHQEICIDPEITLYVPNTFTPDDNGNNEYFMPVGTGLNWSTLHMMIFDRWGNLIYETFDINDPWDGRVQGSSDLVQIDTYVWKIDVTDIKNNKHSLIGHVNVIR